MKINNLKKCQLPFFEQGLGEYLNAGFDNISFSHSCEQVVDKTDVVIILVNTPSSEKGEFSNEYIYNVINSLALLLKKSDKKDFLFILSSTVMPGSSEDIIERIEAISKKKLNEDFS